jgi:chromosome segregation ATPase
MNKNDELYKKKYLKYKEKYLFLQQIAAGYQKQKDFTKQIQQQVAKIDTITTSVATTKEQVKTAIAAEVTALDAYNKNVEDKNALKTLNQNKSNKSKLKSKLESAINTLTKAKASLASLRRNERKSKAKVAENNADYARKIVIEKKKIIKATEKKIEKLNAQLKKTQGDLEVAKTKEVEAQAKAEEMKNELVKVEQEASASLDADDTQTNTVTSSPVASAVPTQ